MPSHRQRAAVTVALTCAAVATLGAPASGDEPAITWEQVRAGLPAMPPAGTAVTRTGGATVSVPDLSAALDDRSAAPAVRRAACHQVTGLDDESAAPLRACLRYVASHR